MFALRTFANLCTTQSSKYTRRSPVESHLLDLSSCSVVVAHGEDLRAELAHLQAPQYQSSGRAMGGKGRGTDAAEQLGALPR